MTTRTEHRTPALTRRVMTAAAAALVSVTLVVPAAGAASGTQGTSDDATPVVSRGGVTVLDPQAPTAEELAAQRAEARRLREESALQEGTVAQARAQLRELAAQAGAALEVYTTAVRAQEAAQTDRAVQEQRLGGARIVLEGTQAALGRWASAAYRDGRAAVESEGLMTLLESENSDDLGRRLSMLQHVGQARGEVLSEAVAAEAEQADALSRSAEAAANADAAAQAATDAKGEADRLVAEQRAQLARLNGLLVGTQDAAGTAETQAAQLTRARSVAEQRRLAARDQVGNVVTGVVGTCAGADVSIYPNGAIPVTALCPLWGASGHYLRADAAYAFDRLSEAYASQYGQALCVTDSYRTFDEQVQLYATKPSLAAFPGTSNHGWGTAVDLCGGVQDFGTVPHRWMQLNAPLFGFFHPQWAQEGGSKPEPWHWEYGR